MSNGYVISINVFDIISTVITVISQLLLLLVTVTDIRSISFMVINPAIQLKQPHSSVRLYNERIHTVLYDLYYLHCI